MDFDRSTLFTYHNYKKCYHKCLKGASILSGFGFSGYDKNGESLWNDAANVKVCLIEVPPNFKVLLDSWNMKTNVWLRECVYKRVTPKGKRPGFRSSMITFVTSAFWVCCIFNIHFVTVKCQPSTVFLEVTI